MDNIINKKNLREVQLRMLEILIEVDRICKKYNINYWISDGTLLGAIRHQGFIPWDDDIDISMLENDYKKFCKVIEYELDQSKFFIANRKHDKHCIPKYLKIRDRSSTLIEFIESENEKYHQGIFIDIFPMVYLNSNVKKIPKIYNYLSTRKDFDIRYEKNAIKKLIKKVFIYMGGRKLLTLMYWMLFKTYNKTNCIGYKYNFNNTYNVDDIFPLKTISFENYSFLSPSNPDGVLTMLYGDYMKLPSQENRVWHAKAIHLDTPCYFERYLKSKN